jgi:hypothetical protein
MFATAAALLIRPNPPLQRTRFAPEIGAILQRDFVLNVVPISTARR